jgi:hydroxymethylbilane synthase
MRGNIPTRLKKLAEGQCDAMILAAAGLLRLEMEDKIKEYLPVDVCTPAVGQAALAVECRSGDGDLCRILDEIADRDATLEVEAERAFLDELGSGCSVPAGALGRIEAGKLTLHGCVASLDGSEILRDQTSGDASNAYHLGKALAHKMLAAGAEKILVELRRSTPNVVSPP